MVTQNFRWELAAPRQAAMNATCVRWLERLPQTVFLTLWMLSPFPVELAQPTLRFLTELRARAVEWLPFAN